MQLKEICDLLKADICAAPEGILEKEIFFAFSSDILSVVLAYSQPDCILITRMNNPQVIRTAGMQDMPCVVITGEKRPADDVLEAAKDFSLCVLSTEHSTFQTCGLLYENGIRGVEVNECK